MGKTWWVVRESPSPLERMAVSWEGLRFLPKGKMSGKKFPSQDTNRKLHPGKSRTSAKF